MSDKPVSPDEGLRSLVERAQQGDRDALAEIYDLYSDRVFRYALVVLREPETAEDVVSEVFLGILRNVKTFEFRPGSSFDSWVMRIAHNVLVDEGRRRMRRPVAPLDEVVWSEQAQEPGPEDEVLRMAEFDAVWSEVEHLPASQRRVLELRIVAGLSAEETSELMGKSPGAVRVLQHRALENLRSRMRSRKRA